jgi:GNAT superfamily N-acetyltransferase
MELTVLPRVNLPTSWLREFARMETDWCAGVAEPVDVAGATVFSSEELSKSVEANSVANAWIPPGMSVPELMKLIDAAKRRDCLRWWTNQSMPAERIRPVEIGLAAAGWQRVGRPLLRWTEGPPPPAVVAGFTVVPSRSAYAAYSDFHDDPAAVAHLDDPQVESWVALSTGRAVGVATVQISAQTAVLRDWSVVPDFRHRGIGRVLLGRVLDMCRRAEVKGLLAITEDEAKLTAAGFEVAGEWVEYRADAVA